MADDAEQYRKNAEEAKRFAALLFAGPCNADDLHLFEIDNMYYSMLELTVEELEADEGITKAWLFRMVEELHEMLERTIIARATKTNHAELFYWIDAFAGTSNWLPSYLEEE